MSRAGCRVEQDQRSRQKSGFGGEREGKVAGKVGRYTLGSGKDGRGEVERQTEVVGERNF